jgi:CheY-like chemotaxis protein
MLRKFLVVDDSDLFRAVLGKVLRKRWPEAQVVEATNGYAAGMLVNNEKPDVVLLDLNMPGGTDGFGVMENIQTDYRRTSAKIVVISGTEEPDMDRRVKTWGAHAFIKKPIVPDRVIKVVAELLGEDDPVEAGGAVADGGDDDW